MPDAAGPDMDLSRLPGWIEYCRSLSGRPRDEMIAGGGWIVSGSTPPPTWEDPLARLPLERVERLVEEALVDDAASGRERRLREALAWLDHPHPASSRAIVDLLAAERRRIEGLLA